MFTKKKGAIILVILVLILTLCCGCGGGGGGSGGSGSSGDSGSSVNNSIGSSSWKKDSNRGGHSQSSQTNSQSNSQLTMKILIPAYCYPTVGDFWSRLYTESAKQPGLIHVVVNMDNGPSQTVNSDYVTAINKLRSNGGKCYGYVDSNYGNRASNVVKADIDRWYKLYNIDGIFIDQQATTSSKISYYQDIYNYIKGKSGVDSTRKLVIANPGTNTIEAYIKQRTADIIVNFESGSAAYDSWKPSSWYQKYDRSNFWHIIYGVNSSNWQAKLERAYSLGAGWVYITDDTLVPNPYDALPTYFSKLCEYVRKMK